MALTATPMIRSQRVRDFLAWADTLAPGELMSTFAEYKESMVDLLARVVRVSVETVAITGAMRLRGGTVASSGQPN